MRFRKFLPACVVLLVVFGFNQTLSAQRDRDRGRDRGRESRWIHLGEKHVDGKYDHDTISIGRSAGRFRQLQIRVFDAPVNFLRVVVHFANGADEELQFRETVRPGTETRAMDLRGYERELRSVEFWYEKASWGRRRPRVELFGRR